ncbi:MAG: hypothetical protein ABSG21_10995 [Spirochaetia bacterium]
MKRIGEFTALSLALLLAACWPPPFNLSVSSSAKTARMLSYVGQVGPIDSNSVMLGTQGTEDVVFLPEKDGAGGITIQAGFILSMDPFSGQQVNFVASNGSQYVRYGSAQGLGPLSTDPYPNFLVQSVKSTHNVIVFQYFDTTPANNEYMLATGDPIAGTFNSSGWTVLHTTYTDVLPFTPPFVANGRVIGVSIYPDPSSFLDRSFWLLRESGTNNYLEGEFDVSQNPITPPGTKLRLGGTYDISSFVGGTAKRVLYYFNPVTSQSYVSIWNSPLSPGNWSTWVWIDSTPTYRQLSSIGNRIDALLTTGELFSTEGNTGRVYDPTTPTGSLEATFPLNDLRFIGEVYIGGIATMLFSEALWYGRQVSFNVYSIPTSQIKTLGQ